ncbi:hypothetical protein K491DRAFT_575088, partial [Lophiostoma macrostomum CBS 122681]
FSPRISILISAVFVEAHTIITYPGWRGNNLGANGSIADTNGLGVGDTGGALVYPYGMQWIYPCGGLPISQNRTKWPVTGGAIAVSPGMSAGHSTALIYINLGVGSTPGNYSMQMGYSPFEIAGPSDNGYNGHFCLPQIPLPAGSYTPSVGDEATIQVVEAAKHGAALYSCVDIVFADAADVAEINQTNCFNSTDPDTRVEFGFINSSLDS